MNQLTLDDCNRIINISSGWITRSIRDGIKPNRPIEPRKELCLYWLARAIRQIDAIFLLYEKEHLSDVQILYRTQVERFFTLIHLLETNEIQDFDDFSFIEIFEIRNKVRSKKSEIVEADSSFWQETPNRIKKYNQLIMEGKGKWIRPNAKRLEAIAKKHGHMDLFDFGYKSASGEVHPLATDGMDEFKQLFNYITSTSFLEKQRHMALLLNPITVFLNIVMVCLDELLDEFDLDYEVRSWPYSLLNLVQGHDFEILDSVRNYPMKAK